MLGGECVCYCIDAVVAARCDNGLTHRSIWCWEANVFVVVTLGQLSLGDRCGCYVMRKLYINRYYLVVMCLCAS